MKKDVDNSMKTEKEKRIGEKTARIF